MRAFAIPETRIPTWDIRTNDTCHQVTHSVVMGVWSLKSTGLASGLETQAGPLSKLKLIPLFPGDVHFALKTFN